MARADAASRSTPPSCSSRTTAGSSRRSARRCSSSRADARASSPAPWHAWRTEQAARELALGRAIERQQAEVARLERFVARWGAGTRARQAQSRAKALEKIERIERAPTDGAALSFQLRRAAAQRPRHRSSSRTARIEVGEPPIVLLEHAQLWLERGEHVVARRAQRLRQDDADRDARRRSGRSPRGKLRTGHNVQIGYLSQHADELGNDGTVLEAAQRATGLTPNRRARCSAVSCSAASSPRSRSPASRAASGAGSRSRSSSPAARTC